MLLPGKVRPIVMYAWLRRDVAFTCEPISTIGGEIGCIKASRAAIVSITGCGDRSSTIDFIIVHCSNQIDVIANADINMAYFKTVSDNGKIS